MAAVESDARPNCFQCAAFFITYDSQRPYGCRAFGMKSRLLPALAIFQTSGQHCQLFQPKPAPPRPR